MKVCPHCQVEQPFTAFHRNAGRADGLAVWCKACKRSDRARHYQANRARILLQGKAWKVKNRSEYQKQQLEYRILRKPIESSQKRVYYIAHKDEFLRRQKEWRLKNREKYLAYHRTEQMLRRATGGIVSSDLIRQRSAMWGNRCWICGEVATATDHVKPLANGGTHWASNLRPICKPCNSSKADKWLGAPRLLELKVSLWK